MTVTYEKLQSWKPDGLSGAADKLNNLRKKLIDQQDEMDAGKPPASWQTPNSSEAARSRHKRLVEDLNDIAAPLSAVVAGLDSAASSLRSAKESAKTAYDGAIAKGWTVKFPGGTQVEIEDPTPPESKAPGNRRGTPVGHPDQDTMDSYAQTISKALSDATEAESELEAVLNTATSGGYDGGDGEIADAIPPEIGKILASGQEDGDKPDKAAMQRYAAYMDELEDEPELKREIMSQMGREGIANAFKNAEAVGVDLHAAMGATGRGVIEDWVEHDITNKGVSGDTATLLGAYKKDAEFTKELFTNVSPDEWADAIKHENDEAFSNGKIDEADRKVYSEFLRAGGSALATYTQGHPDPKGLAGEWFKAITEGDDENASALTLMIKKGGEDGGAFQTDFMYNLTDDVYNWERNHDGDPVWGPKSAGLLDPDAEVGSAARGRGAYVWTSGHADDGMANLLGGLNHSPEAAQRFFADDTLDNGDSDDRLKYFMLDRTFASDNGSDEGDGLGLALEAATVGGKSIDPELSASIASEVMQTIADNSGKDDGWFEDGWHTWPEMNDSLGAIASGYSNDVYDLLSGEVPNGKDELRISEDDFKVVLGELGRGEDKTGAEMVGAAMVAEGNDRIDGAIQDYLKKHPGADIQEVNREIGGLLSGHNTRTGEVLAETVGSSVLVDLEGEEEAAAKAEFMQKAISIGSGFIPGAGDVIGESLQGATKHVVGSAIDTATSEGVDALKNAVAAGDPPSSAWIAKQDNAGELLMERSAMNTYLRNGLLPDYLNNSAAVVNTPDGPVFRPELFDSSELEKLRTTNPQLVEDWNKWHGSDEELYALDVGVDGLQQYDDKLQEAVEYARNLR
ncbi:hypothetical protein ACIO3S_16585 [Nocardioides sp. NPDC087217]|uniref:hypothetical protein n=1 Tax=Nocardioides sp. NPDC087217 TaxID=3364335 RepID=UPI0037F5483C